MRKMRLLVVVGLLAFCAASGWAQGGRLVLQPFAGYRTSGTFGIRADVPINFSGIRVTEGFAYGFSLGYRINPLITVEALWAHSDPTMEAISSLPTTPDQSLFEIGEDQIHANFLFYLVNNPKFQPFFVTGLGVTVANPKIDEIGSETRFSWNLGLGIDLMFNEKVGFRAQAKWFTTYINDTLTWMVDWWGYVWLVPVSQYMGQWDFTGGIVFRF